MCTGAEHSGHALLMTSAPFSGSDAAVEEREVSFGQARAEPGGDDELIPVAEDVVGVFISAAIAVGDGVALKENTRTGSEDRIATCHGRSIIVLRSDTASQGRLHPRANKKLRRSRRVQWKGDDNGASIPVSIPEADNPESLV